MEARNAMSHQLSSAATGSPAGVTRCPDVQSDIEERLTRTVMHSFDGCQDERLTFLMKALVRHLHAFIREVRLTEAEWNAAIEFLTAVGHITDDRRQEFILLSDVLGASMQTINVNNEAYGDATEATVFGPFFVEDSPRHRASAATSPAGRRAAVLGRGHRHRHRRPPGPGRPDRGVGGRRGRLLRRPVRRRPGRRPGPPVQRRRRPLPLLGHSPRRRTRFRTTGRSAGCSRPPAARPMRASHLHFMVSAPGLRTLVTHIFVRGDELLSRDTVFGVKESLVKDFAAQPADTPTPDGRDLGDRTWSRVGSTSSWPPPTTAVRTS